LIFGPRPRFGEETVEDRKDARLVLRQDRALLGRRLDRRRFGRVVFVVVFSGLAGRNAFGRELAKRLDHLRARPARLFASFGQLPAKHGERTDAEQPRECGSAERASDRPDFRGAHCRRIALQASVARTIRTSSKRSPRSARKRPSTTRTAI